MKEKNKIKMYKKISVISYILIAACFTTISYSQENAIDPLDQAEVFINADKGDEALQVLSDAIDNGDTRFEVFLQKARILRFRKDFESSSALWHSYINKIDESNTEAWSEYASSLGEIKEVMKSMEAFEKWMDLDSKNPGDADYRISVLANYAVYMSRYGHYDLAARPVAELEKIPSNQWPYFPSFKGMIALVTGKYGPDKSWKGPSDDSLMNVAGINNPPNEVGLLAFKDFRTNTKGYSNILSFAGTSDDSYEIAPGIFAWDGAIIYSDDIFLLKTGTNVRIKKFIDSSNIEVLTGTVNQWRFKVEKTWKEVKNTNGEWTKVESH